MTADSSRWDRYAPRDGDIVIATYPKCGTTWTQRIVDLLVFQNTEVRDLHRLSPWLDWSVIPLEPTLAALEGQTNRRFIKSHLPFDSLPIYEGVSYIHVARDGRDACWSLHNHELGFKQELRGDDALQEPVPDDPHEYYLAWIAAAESHDPSSSGGALPFFEFELTYWRERERENLLFVHFNDLKADLEGEMARISAFLGIDTPPSKLRDLAAAASFESMKRDGSTLLPMLAVAFDHGADRFLNKGTNGRWRDVLTADDVARYEALARRKCPPELASWIERGRIAP